MKILQINKFHYPKGGADKYYLELSDLLRKNGHKVINFAMRDENNLPSPFSKYFVSKVDFSQVKFNKEGLRAAGRMIYSFEAKKKIEQLIKDTKPDIAHIHNIYHQISPSILPVLKKHKIPVVMTAHDYKLISPNYSMYHDGAICEHAKTYRFWNTFLYKCVKGSYVASALTALEMSWHKIWRIYEKNLDVIITPSQFMADKFIEYKQDEKKIKVIPHFVDKEWLQNENKEKSEDYFVYFGRLSEEKGIGDILEALSLLPNIKLKIIGQGPLEKKLKEQTRDLLLEKQMEFLGRKDGEELKNIIKKSLAVIVPSVWYEVFGLVVIEAMALAKPVVGSKIGGIPELINDGEDGFLFEAGDYKDLAVKMKWIFNHREEAEKMGRQGRAKVKEKFLSQDHYQKIISIYEKLLR